MHTYSGTIQRHLPTESLSKRDSIYYYEEDGLEKLREQISKDMSLSEDFSVEERVFSVHSMGWMEFDESQLTPELSSKAIKQCILELTTQSEHAVRVWGKQETKRLTLRIEDRCLKLLDPISGTILTTQPIATIRVWGVNDSDDFAYVARDQNFIEDESTERDGLLESEAKPPVLKCHVFHCENESGSENSAQKIANLLKEGMIKIKSMQQNPGMNRPQDLVIDEFTSTPIGSPSVEFPTPIEEPRKTIVARYLGKISVPKPTGVETLNEAISKICFDIDSNKCASFMDSGIDSGRGEVVLVHISPSKVSVESSVNGEIFVDCRVRYLSFLGISRNDVRCCGFILQIDEKTFEAHCFQCDPSAGALCKTIEAACKLRFQKCLDAHKQRCSQQLEAKKALSSQPSRSASISAIKSSVVNAFSKFLKK